MIRRSVFLLLCLLSLIGCPACGPAKKADATTTVTAAQVIADYEENESIADEKYQGKRLILSGRISHFAQIRGTIGVYFKPVDLVINWQIICFIDKASEPDAYSKLEKEKNVTLVGTIEDQPYSWLVSINDVDLSSEFLKFFNYFVPE